MPVKVLIQAADTHNPDQAIVESKNLLRADRWGIPEEIRQVAKRFTKADSRNKRAVQS